MLGTGVRTRVAGADGAAPRPPPSLVGLAAIARAGLPGRVSGWRATTDVQPRPRDAGAGAGVDVCERPGPVAGRGIWAMGARKSANFPSDAVEDDTENEEAEAERRGVGMRESIRRISCTLLWGS